jgi:hypothetical protein
LKYNKEAEYLFKMTIAHTESRLLYELDSKKIEELKKDLRNIHGITNFCTLRISSTILNKMKQNECTRYRHLLHCTLLCLIITHRDYIRYLVILLEGEQQDSTNCNDNII